MDLSTDLEPELAEQALFEVADITLAASLAARLAGRWNVIVSSEWSDTVAVLAEVCEQDDLALLLRTVERWVADEHVCALRFAVDGRSYVLQAGTADWSHDLTEGSAVPPHRERARLLQALGEIDRALLAARPAHPRAPHVIGLESLRRDISLALRLDAESP